MADLGFAITVSDKSNAALNEFFKAFPGVVPKVLNKVGIFGKKLIVTATPVKTGAARKSWRINKIGKDTVSIASDFGRGSKYTPFLETGTGIYGPKGTPITAKNNGYLRFPIIVGNSIKSWVTTKEVKGFKPFAMVKKSQPAILKHLGETAKAIISEMWKGNKPKETV